ncbi:FtsW/RodA/SpoVE family cell cycle protein [Lachnospiraceae bacterium MD1]|uniref:FtsW/RodA/SpoVE family cell cycle protein n=1 Tax=Variimorphobacter saccharofermentans TaxID=2755051 RepID=A0A839JWV9_9FIRM|nr:FtsW/RodA/SpoVE family cell cycle protein [Variimorphobacter saccharofermentans]MBB2182165.1 FtsW/RodA/SpoVE family cell cycle protein [Variimorphobacter saccharofermentans]
MKEKLLHYIKKIDYIILIAMTILIGIGVYCGQQAFMLSEEQHSIFIKQIAGIIIGYAFIIAILLFDYRFICNLSFVLYLGMISMLAFILVFGENLNNVKRWIVIFGIQFQPSELTKIVLVLFLAFLCNYFKNKLNKFYVLIILGVVIAIPMLLIVLEPHLSSALALLFIFAIMVYASGMSYKVIGAALAIILPVIAGIVIGVAVFHIDIPLIKDYHVNRVLSFLSDDESENLDEDYQQIQSIEAIGAGGLHGKMLSTEADENRRYSNIYAKESDFVFAIVGEEFGFLGCVFIISLYAIIIIRCVMISAHATDYMGKQIGIGISAYMIFQIFVNIGVAVNLLPNTGLPLPFISYGLTSLVSSMIAVGLILNVGMRQKTKTTKPIM